MVIFTTSPRFFAAVSPGITPEVVGVVDQGRPHGVDRSPEQELVADLAHSILAQYKRHASCMVNFPRPAGQIVLGMFGSASAASFR